jgi:hypothetical protein
VIVVWANVHASFLFGLGLAAAFALEALLAEPKAWPRVVRQWGVFGVGPGLAALINPHGIDGVLFPLRVNGMDSLSSITEWRGPDLVLYLFLKLAVPQGIIGALAIKRCGHDGASR